MYKICMIFGKGRDGCGVNRFGRELQLWAEDHKEEFQFDIVSIEEGFFCRAEGHKMEFIEKTLETEDEAKEVQALLETYDMVIYNSYPSNKHGMECIRRFYTYLVEGLQNPIKVGMMHELIKGTVDKIPYLVAICNHCDVIYNFSTETWFSKEIARLLPGKANGRVRRFAMPWAKRSIDKLVAIGQSVPKEKKITYLGRWTSMKDPHRLLDLHPLVKAQDPEFKIELRGIERSIGALHDIFKQPNVYDFTSKSENRFHDWSMVHVFGPYMYEEGMRSLASSMFGASFYRMPNTPEGYGNRMEYTQMEIIAMGCIPLFDKHWGENNRTADGTRYIDLPDMAIFSDKEDLPATVEEIMRLTKDDKARQRMLDHSLEVVRYEFDADRNARDIIDNARRLGKDPNKFGTVKELTSIVTGTPFFGECAEKMIAKGKTPVLGIRELDGCIFSILDGKKERELWRRGRKGEIVINKDKSAKPAEETEAE